MTAVTDPNWFIVVIPNAPSMFEMTTANAASRFDATPRVPCKFEMTALNTLSEFEVITQCF